MVVSSKRNGPSAECQGKCTVQADARSIGNRERGSEYTRCHREKFVQSDGSVTEHEAFFKSLWHLGALLKGENDGWRLLVLWSNSSR